MTRINRPDTLLTELREIKRRLRLLEAGRMRPAGALAATVAAGPDLESGPAPGSGVPLMPARPLDWPSTGSEGWERLAVTRAAPTERGAVVELHLVADAGTSGAVRVVVDSQPAGEPIPVSATLSTRTVAVTVASRHRSEVAVEGRRTRGGGMVRVSALLLPAGPPPSVDQADPPGGQADPPAV